MKPVSSKSFRTKNKKATESLHNRQKAHLTKKLNTARTAYQLSSTNPKIKALHDRMIKNGLSTPRHLHNIVGTELPANKKINLGKDYSHSTTGSTEYKLGQLDADQGGDLIDFTKQYLPSDSPGNERVTSEAKIVTDYLSAKVNLYKHINKPVKKKQKKVLQVTLP